MSPVDDDHGWRRWLLTLVAIPLGVVLLVPLAVVFALWFYLAVCIEGARFLVRLVSSRGPEDGPPTDTLQAPHFGETHQRSITGAKRSEPEA
jgi:hypothetical protein